MKLIFLVSQPRAGSTMLQRIISNHPSIATCSEPWVALPLVNLFFNRTEGYQGDFALATKAIADSKSKTWDSIRRIREFLINYYSTIANEAKFFLDKTPRYYKILNELVQLFPEAYFLILKRQPGNVARSIIQTWNYRNPIQLSYHHYHDLCEAPHCINNFIKHSDAKNLKVIKYEDITNAPKDQISSIFEFLCLNYDDSYLDPSRNNKLSGTLGDPVNAGVYSAPQPSINISKTNSSFAERFGQEYEGWLGKDFIESYGYTFSGSQPRYLFKSFLLAHEHANARRQYRLGHFLKIRYLITLSSLGL